MSLIEKAREAVKCGGGVRRWVDRRLKDSFPMEVAEKMVQVALECVEDEEDGWVEKKSFMSSISNSHDPHVFINDGAVTENDDRYDVGTKIQVQNRRERISERLKILQELVPNGCKVDLVTMLEKAISYVKFLQLQVKVLATDEFWPVQGGKAPDISQVKEAIDAILSSQRDTSSSSKL
ncbi:hypothetical protein ACLB2K_006919 [Fragaria x ananassa]